MASHRNAKRLSQLQRAAELGIAGRHKMNSGTLQLRIQEEEARRSTPVPAETIKYERCSACGSAAPHHVDYVRQHGLCVV